MVTTSNLFFHTNLFLARRPVAIYVATDGDFTWDSRESSLFNWICESDVFNL